MQEPRRAGGRRTGADGARRGLEARLRSLAVGSVVVGVGLALVGATPGLDRPDSPRARAAGLDTSFATDVMPLLEKYCVECHGGMKDGEKVLEEGLDLTSYETLMVGSTWGTVVEAGDAENSLMVQMLVDGDMPKDADEPMPPEEIAVIRSWIDEGAPNN
ncbi:MAG: c-type cytochrome domain-containing protein [Gemmatimonadota bacterium]